MADEIQCRPLTEWMWCTACGRKPYHTPNHVIIPFTNLGSEAALRLDVPAQRAVMADGTKMGELDTDQTPDLSDCRGSGVGCLGGVASS